MDFPLLYLLWIRIQTASTFTGTVISLGQSSLIEYLVSLMMIAGFPPLPFLCATFVTILKLSIWIRSWRVKLSLSQDSLTQQMSQSYWSIRVASSFSLPYNERGFRFITTGRSEEACLELSCWLLTALLWVIFWEGSVSIGEGNWVWIPPPSVRFPDKILCCTCSYFHVVVCPQSLHLVEGLVQTEMC